MTDDQILQQVGEIVAETVGLETLVLTATTTAADVEGWDSLTNVQIIVAIEKRFGIRLRTGEIASIKNVGELVARISSRLGSPRNA
jgi:acyl carrier protein